MQTHLTLLWVSALLFNSIIFVSSGANLDPSGLCTGKQTCTSVMTLFFTAGVLQLYWKLLMWEVHHRNKESLFCVRSGFSYRTAKEKDVPGVASQAVCQGFSDYTVLWFTLCYHSYLLIFPSKWQLHLNLGCCWKFAFLKIWFKRLQNLLF